MINIEKFKIKSLSYYLISSVISTLIGLIINPFLSIGLSHTDYAIIGYFGSFSTVLTPIVAFSLYTYYSKNFFVVDEKERNQILQTILSLFLIFGLFIFFVFFLLYYIYHKKNIISIPFSPFAILSFAPIYVSSFYNLYILDLRMQEKAKKYAFITILNSLLGAILSLLLVYFYKFGATGRLLSTLIVSLFFAIFSFKVLKFRLYINKSIIKSALSFCWPLTISAILTFFFMGIDRTLLVRLNDNYTLGLYNVGLQISGYLGIFGTVILQTFQPDIYKLTSQNKHKKVFLLIGVIVGLSVLPNLFFIILSKPIVSILTYGRYIDATGFANVLSLRNISVTFAFTMSETLIAYGFPRYELMNRIVGSIIAFLLYEILIHYWGYSGAAWGQSISWIFMGFISSACLFYVKFRK